MCIHLLQNFSAHNNIIKIVKNKLNEYAVETIESL